MSTEGLVQPNGLLSRYEHIMSTPKALMGDDPATPKLSVESVTTTRDQIVVAAGGDEPFRDELSRASIILVPMPGHAGYTQLVFPHGTLEVLRLFREHTPEGITTDIAITDDAYEELALHAADIILVTVFVKDVLVPIVLGLYSSYLYDLLKDASARRETRVRAKVLVETRERTIAIDYYGPADEFTELTRRAFEQTVQPSESFAPELSPACAEVGRDESGLTQPTVRRPD